VTDRHDSTDVPLSWLCAEEAACALIVARRPGWFRASFEFRATQHVLALTGMLADTAEVNGNFPARDKPILRRLLADDVEWAVWCRGQLDKPAPGLTLADIYMARNAWRWLSTSRLLAGSFQESCSLFPAAALFRGVGVALGVALSRGVLEDGAHQS
jgi:hypothetical protein